MAGNFSEVGINFSIFQNISFDSMINATNLTGQEFVASIPETANTLTEGYYGAVVLIVMGIVLIQLLSDISQYGLFRYSTVRALAISLGIMCTFGVNMLAIGFMTNFIHLVTFHTLYILLLIYIIISNPS